MEHEKGVFYYADGGKYVGDFENEKADGTGVSEWENGSKYESELRNDLQHGQGTYYFEDN